MKKAEQKDGQKNKGKRFKEKSNKKEEDKITLWGEVPKTLIYQAFISIFIN